MAGRLASSRIPESGGVVKPNPSIRKPFSAPGLCECCGVPCPESRECHHVFTRGAGGPDIRENLIGLCFQCHRRFHDGHEPRRETMLAIIAEREGKTVEAIVEAVNAKRRLR